MSTTEPAFDDFRAFMRSRVLLTATELDLFTQLDIQPRSAEALAGSLHLDERATSRLLDCLVTLNLLGKEGNVYRLTTAGSPFSANHPQSIYPSVLHSVRLWKTWSGLTETVQRGTNPILSPPGVDTFTRDDRTAFIDAMHVAGKKKSVDIAGKYDLQRFKKMMDIGGGSGAYTIAFLQKNPDLRAVYFDLPGVVPIAQVRIREEKLLDRVQFVGGDYLTDPLPSGCDFAFLSAIIHQNNPAQNQKLYQKVFDVLRPGGVLLIRDHVMDSTRTSPLDGALFAINMLVNTYGGDTFTYEEIRSGLEKAGFQSVRQVASGERMDCLVEARKES